MCRDNLHSPFYWGNFCKSKVKPIYPCRWFISISLRMYLGPVLAHQITCYFVTRLCYLTWDYCLNSLRLQQREKKKKISKRWEGQAVSCLTDVAIPSCTPQPSLSSRWGWSCTMQHGYGFKAEIYILKWLQLSCTMPNLLEVWWVYFINSRNAAERQSGGEERQTEQKRDGQSESPFYSTIVQHSEWECVSPVYVCVCAHVWVCSLHMRWCGGKFDVAPLPSASHTDCCPSAPGSQVCVISSCAPGNFQQICQSAWAELLL